MRIAVTMVAVAAAGMLACQMRPQVAPAPATPVVSVPAAAADAASAWPSLHRGLAEEPPPKIEKAETVARTVPEPVLAKPPLPSLIGLSRDQLAELFGPPRFKRRDNPVEIWQYRSAECTLDLFLYQDGKSDVFKVTHFEVRGRGQKMSADDCVGTLGGPRRAS